MLTGQRHDGQAFAGWSGKKKYYVKNIFRSESWKMAYLPPAPPAGHLVVSICPGAPLAPFHHSDNRGGKHSDSQQASGNPIHYEYDVIGLQHEPACFKARPNSAGWRVLGVIRP